ncbi:MAG: hypothetical protein Fues2KO_33510 [Fuerstiella sp.]
MSVLHIILAEIWRSSRAMLPGLSVLVCVLYLLRGWSGLTDAVHLQATAIIHALFGTADGVGTVFIATLPLALSAAIAAFCIAERWLSFESFASVIGLALIILCGTGAGAALRSAVQPAGSSELNAEIADAAVQPLRQSLNEAVSDSFSIANNRRFISPLAEHDRTDLRANLTDDAQPSTGAPVTVPSPKPTSWWDVPDIDHLAAAPVSDVRWFPEPNGLLKPVGRAANVLLSYLSTYQLRLFLAALIAGGWIGLSCQRRWHEAVVRSTIDENGSKPTSVDPGLRRAA